MNLGSIRTSAWSVAQTYHIANPGVIRHVWKARPAGLSDLPACFIGDIRTTLQHTAGTRIWVAEVDVVLVDNVSDNEETMARLDISAMALVDAFTDQPHAFGDNTVAEPASVQSTTVDVNGTNFEARVVTVGRIQFTEGR